MGTEINGSLLANEQATHSTTCRKFIASAGLGFAGLIQTQDVFSMAQDESEAIHQTISEHARRESLPADPFDLSR